MNDIINSIFEFACGLFCWVNVMEILRRKKVEGVRWEVQGLFALWGWWNLYYYPSLEQWHSFFGSIFLAVGNTTWVVLAIKYKCKILTKYGIK